MRHSTRRTASDSDGYYIEPTVVVTENPHATTMTQELFGPVVTVYVYPAEQYEETVSYTKITILLIRL